MKIIKKYDNMQKEFIFKGVYLSILIFKYNLILLKNL